MSIISCQSVSFVLKAKFLLIHLILVGFLANVVVPIIILYNWFIWSISIDFNYVKDVDQIHLF